MNRVSCNQRSVTMQGLQQLDDRQHIRLGDTYSRNMAHGGVNSAERGRSSYVLLHSAESLGTLFHWAGRKSTATTNTKSFVALSHLGTWFK